MRRLTTKQLVLCALMGALMVAVKEPLSAVPVELVTLLVVLYTLELPDCAPWAVTVFVALELLLYGVGLWTVMYLYIWYLLYGLTRLFRRQDAPLFWALFSGGFGLAFGALCTPVYFLLQGPGGALAWWASGLLHDVFHGLCNFGAMLLLYRPLRRALAGVAARLR